MTDINYVFIKWRLFMLIDITQETKIGKIYRPGSPALNVKEIICNQGTKSEYKIIEYTICYS